MLGETGVLNPLRFEDEFVRHKILDVIGDLALVGHPIQGHLVVHRGGHALHTAFAAEVLRQRDAWQFVDAPAETVRPRRVRVSARRLTRRVNRPTPRQLRARLAEPRDSAAPRLRLIRLRSRGLRPARRCAIIRSFSNRLKLMNRLSLR